MRLLTSHLPGTGGLMKSTPEDFVVEELPAYPPSGEGAHTFVEIEKRALTTDDAVRRICDALGCQRDDAGVAGMKDRQAVTRQWISLPGVDPQKALALALDGIRVLSAARHPHKLRTGHLRGNRFALTIRGVTDGAARARAVLDVLRTRGLPNYFGAQRFGARGDNAALGRALARGERLPGRRSRSELRLFTSAYQSELFNRYLDRRIDDGLLSTALAGDLMRKRDTGGLFAVEDVAEAQSRLDAQLIDPTGPMFGARMTAPPDGSAARAREDAILADEGVAGERIPADGTRRPLVVPVDAAEADEPEPGVLIVRFALPSGAYATGVLAEITKS
jgi:tRNA pseudouridine13 synthase